MLRSLRRVRLHASRSGLSLPAGLRAFVVVDGAHRRGCCAHLPAVRAAEGVSAGRRSAASPGSSVSACCRSSGCAPLVWGLSPASVCFLVLYGRPIRHAQVVSLAALPLSSGATRCRRTMLVALLQGHVDPESEGRIALTCERRPAHQVDVSDRYAPTSTSRSSTTPMPTSLLGHSIDVLIVGAGTGTTSPSPSSEGARHVDAVEIDPRLLAAGQRLHPTDPTTTLASSVHIDDGRAFLEQHRRTYDLILFALPDSLTLVSGQSSLRLESYLFTREAIEAAREHLEPTGCLLDVQLLPRGLARRPLAGTLEDGVRSARPASTRRGEAGRRPSSRSADDRRCDRLRRPWEPGGDVVAPSRRPTIIRSPICARPDDPRLLSVTLGADRSVARRLPVRVSWAGRSADARATSTSSSWARRSSCWRRRASCSSRCSSARLGS